MSLPPHVLPVRLEHAYRLLNHGPTVLVSSAHAGRCNVMAAAWNMPLEFSPPRLAVVIDKSTLTRELVEASGRLVLNLPPQALADACFAVGSVSSRELAPAQDKLTAFGLERFDMPEAEAPLVGGCLAWLACRVLPEPHVQAAYDLFVVEVLAAWADTRVFEDGRWRPLQDIPPAQVV
ncbi:flavin reductase family protein, partial [Ramlibacter sp. 2FC]|uniref:flavin reductase family protein n=1 Tax=Ramlibacter sp. 2FC TaxID=2502188 RepID=UPI0010F49D28